MDRKYITLERILIVIALIVIVLLWNDCGGHKNEIIKTIPEYIRTTDTIVFNDIKEKKIYIKGKTIYVDSIRYIRYVNEVDTIKKDSMYTDAITIREYDTILEDNNRIKLELHSKVSGRLVNASAKYTIKEIEVEPVIKRPDLTFLLGTGVNFNNSIYMSTGIQLKNGFIIQGAINNKADYSIGICKAFTILK